MLKPSSWIRKEPFQLDMFYRSHRPAASLGMPMGGRRAIWRAIYPACDAWNRLKEKASGSAKTKLVCFTGMLVAELEIRLAKILDGVAGGESARCFARTKACIVTWVSKIDQPQNGLPW